MSLTVKQIQKSINDHLRDLHEEFIETNPDKDCQLLNKVNLTLLEAKDSIQKAVEEHS